MAKKQTRRSVSIKGSTYDRVRNHCRLAGVSMSEFIEDQIASFFSNPADAAATMRRQLEAQTPAPAVNVNATEAVAPGTTARNKKRMNSNELQDAARIFTF